MLLLNETFKMRQLILSLIIVYFFFGLSIKAHSQSKLHKLTIEANPHDFGMSHEYWNQIKLVSKDTVIKVYFPRGLGQLKIDSIPSGSYAVKSMSVFNHTITDSIKFDKRISQNIQFYDQDNYYQILNKKSQFYENMQDTDTLVILFSETGCFHSDFGKMQFIRIGNSWIAQLYNPLTGELIEQRKIQIDEFSNVGILERYMNQSRDSYECTTVGYYSLQYKRKINRHIDGSCSWDGFRKLREEIFGKD